MQPLVRFTAEAVQRICDLLTPLFGRVNTLESWIKVAETQIIKSTEFISEVSPKMAELAGFGTQIQAAFAKAEEVAGQADDHFAPRSAR